jgi:carbamoyltransferase
VLVGGCALNSACNGKIKERTGYENVYVYNAPGDDGTAVGAAILAFLQDHAAEAINRESLFCPYKGSFIDSRSLQKAIDNTPYHYDLGNNRYKIAAKLISTGHVIGWVQGQAEFGPRALGNRSILADPRNAAIKDIINKTLKYRESFRPFAPSVLETFGPEIFEDYQSSWYMDKTLKIKEAWQQRIQGVTHVNGTGRLQSVHQDINPGFFELISEFHKLTGVPVLLNTSFNLAGKPIVHSVNDIVASLYTSGLHAVIIEGHLFTKQPVDLSSL